MSQIDSSQVDIKSTDGKWGIYIDGPSVHVIPINDWIEHSVDTGCICEPEFDIQSNGRAVVIHDAADGRT